MTVSIDSIQKICNDIRRSVENTYPGLSLYFILHHAGKMREAIALAEHEIIAHPASNAARAIIRKQTKGDYSSFMGLAIHIESRFFGLFQKDHLLGLFNINQDDYETEEMARADIYHLAWHAIDLYEIRQQPAYRRKFKDGPMVPKRSALNLSKANLQADSFAAAYSALKRQSDITNLLAKKRGLQSLTSGKGFKAEDFPFVIARDACTFAINEMVKKRTPEEEFLITARNLSLEIGHTFDENNIQQWWDYSIPAQDMAWRGFESEEILGAAVNACENPYVRSIGYLVQEVTGLNPSSAESLIHNYNAFVDPSVNMRLHREMVDTVFEDAVTLGLQQSTSRAFLDAANLQNENLTEGRFLGWCANALQDAAKAFERALITGASPAQAARMEFEGNRNIPTWESLVNLGNKIVDQRRQGYAVTMGHIAEICHNNPDFSPILNALKVTLNDPSYIKKLEAANDLSFNVFAPSAPQPKAPAPKGPEIKPATPAPTAAPSMPQIHAAPGLGGNRAAQMIRQRMLAMQKQKDDNAGKNGDSDDRQPV